MHEGDKSERSNFSGEFMGVITHVTAAERERAVLVTVHVEGKTSPEAEGMQAELVRLAVSRGVEIAGKVICRRKMVTSNFFIGKGKVSEIADLVREDSADVVIFSNDLSPTQQKNLEKVIDAKTIDRTQLILDIFAARASSNEGKVQVELAQLLYLLPRLSGQGVRLSRLGGGIGTRGPGEQKLEVDRRRIRERIGKLKRSLKDITARRGVRHRQRERIAKITVALVGYTNSGKSTLFNTLTNARVTTKNQLFSTLDPTVRKIQLESKQTAFISDTVGFLNDLPHHLVESFKATLEEVVRADVLLHIIDASDHRIEEQKAAVIKVLSELGVLDKTILTVFNKIDKISDVNELKRIKLRFPDSFLISALKGRGLEGVKGHLRRLMDKDTEDIELVIPHECYAALILIREKGTIQREEYRENGVFIKAHVPKKIKYAVLKTVKM